MDAFESLIAKILEREGYWTRIGLKIELTKEEKREIGRPSSPRWELDVLAYRPEPPELLVVECKSYLDSRGVCAAAFHDPHDQSAARYKLFTEPHTKDVVFKRLVRQLSERHLVPESCPVTLCLAAGNIATDRDRETLTSTFAERGWKLFDPRWIRERIEAMAKDGYHNDATMIAAKILLRD